LLSSHRPSKVASAITSYYHFPGCKLPYFVEGFIEMEMGRGGTSDGDGINFIGGMARLLVLLSLG